MKTFYDVERKRLTHAQIQREKGGARESGPSRSGGSLGRWPAVATGPAHPENSAPSTAAASSLIVKKFSA